MARKPNKRLYEIASWSGLAMFIVGWMLPRLIFNWGQRSVLLNLLMILSMVIALLTAVSGIWYRVWCRKYWIANPTQYPAF